MTTRNPLILNNGLISEMTAGDAITASASIIISVLNQTGSTLTKGQAVYISGANGDNPTVTLASASAETTSSKTLGLVYADIANGDIGAVVTSGLFKGIDTSTATAGQSVWLSSTPGGLVFGSQPTQPLHGVFIGKVARVQQNNGSIFVTIQNGYEISELHDVLITSPANNNLLAYDSATSLWKNVSAINGVSVGSTTAAAGAFTTLSASSTVSGTGFSTYLASPPAIGSTTASTGAFTTLSASSTVTLSGGTANGVLYLNGSKAVTSGSALTFDGTNLGIGVTPSGWSGYTAFQNKGVSLASTLNVIGFLSGNSYYNGTNWLYYTGGAACQYAINNAGQHQWFTAPSGTAGTVISFTQAMTLDASGNLVIGGTTSTERLTVIGGNIGLDNTRGLLIKNNAGVGESVISLSSGNNLSIASPTASGSIQYAVRNSSYSHQFFVGGTEYMRLDSAGNLSLGVIPSGWNFGGNIILPSSNNFAWNGPNGNIVSNGYYAGGWKYQTTAAATRYSQDVGVHSWHTAPSGTAGTAISFTQAMTLDASGNLSNVGNLSINTGGLATYFRASGTAYTQIGDNQTLGAGTAFVVGSSSAYLAFQTSGSERARIDSSGNFLLGRTNAASNTGNTGITLTVGTDYANGRWYGTGSQTWHQFLLNGTVIGSITGSGSSTSYNTSSDYRLKHDITPMQNALAKIAQLKPVTYKWNVDNSDGQGFIAHELQTVIPEAVTGEKDAVDDEGNPVYQGIDPSKIVATLTAAIQEQQAIIESLQADIAILKGK